MVHFNWLISLVDFCTKCFSCQREWGDLNGATHRAEDQIIVNVWCALWLLIIGYII